MNLVRYQEWLVKRQWNGYPLEKMLIDAVAAPDSTEFRNGLQAAYRAMRSLNILTNGINGEVGEATEHFKRWVRDGRINKAEAAIELGDVLAYLTWLAATLGFTLEDIAKYNYDKLVARAAAGTGAPAV